MSFTWEGVPGHAIIDEYGRAMDDLTYGEVDTCECGHVFTAISSNKRNAKKLIRRKYRAHLAEGAKANAG